MYTTSLVSGRFQHGDCLGRPQVTAAMVHLRTSVTRTDTLDPKGGQSSVVVRCHPCAPAEFARNYRRSAAREDIECQQAGKGGVARMPNAWVEIETDNEAFLNGHLVERIESRVLDSVPAWAWTNLLAHGTAEAFSRTESGSPRLRRSRQVQAVAPGSLVLGGRST